MLIPIIKDFNNAFSYLVLNSVEKTKEVFDPVSKSLVRLSEGQSDQSASLNNILKIGWTAIQTFFSFFVQAIQSLVSFQWLRDFAYLPVSIPNNLLRSDQNNTFIQNFNNSIVSMVGDRQNLLQRFLFSNQTIAKPETGLNIDSQSLPYRSLPYNNFILGLPNVTHAGTPIHSWSLSFLSNKWFDPLTVPVNFLSTGLESSSKNISQLSSLPEQVTGNFRISNLILMCILICLTTGFSSFFNSFFISFPLSLTNLLSLRYLIIQKFWAGCVSVLGIVLGEIIFMIFLILPPPFIQITLVYIESVWPYIIGLSLIIFIIFDLISNPYTNTISIYQTNNQVSSGLSPLTKPTSIFANNSLIRFLPIKLNNVLKIFGFSFLLSLTEQSCYFSFFGSLNLSSTGNFLDTYLFAASRSPIILFFSCLGFLIGSFLAIIIYNLVIAKVIFSIASLGLKIKQYNPDFFRSWLSNRQTKRWGETPSNLSPSEGYKNNGVFLFQIYTNIKNNILSRLRSLFFFIKSRDSLKSLLLKFKNIIQLFIAWLPGGKRIIFFLFPGQAHSYKSDFKTRPTGQWSREQNFNDKAERPLTTKTRFFPVGFKTEPKKAFLSVENQVENMLRTSQLGLSSSSLSSMPSQVSQDSLLNNNQPFGNASSIGGSGFYNKIDKILLTCLITLSFTTIPYYSFDYLINSFFGFIPQDQILNAHSLRVNFPDYTNLLGITLSDNNSVINTDVSLYDRAHFMYGEWPNSFESLNYQGELMWTNLRDHRRQKRTRRSTRLKFKTLKTKISTSWKEFKRSSGFSGSTSPSPFDSQAKENLNKEYENSKHPEFMDINSGRDRVFEDQKHGQLKTNSKVTSLETSQNSDPSQDRILNLNQTKDNSSRVQKRLRNNNNLSNLFYKIFLSEPDYSHSSSLKEYIPETGSSSILPTNGVSKNEIISKIPEEIRHSTSLTETIKPLSTSTFIDLSGGEKYIKTYPKNWKRVITEKYYQNPIYQTVLSSDLKSFLKREPLTQQLTNNQENELYFLRVKMAHYYDSLRFYFTLKEQINNTRPKADTFFKSGFPPTGLPGEKRQAEPEFEKNYSEPKIFNESSPNSNEKIWNSKQKTQSSLTRTKPEAIISLSASENQTRDASVFSQRENTRARVEESLKRPPFQFKSMTSMNYRQQFKGTLKTVKQLFAISLPRSVSVFSNAPSDQNRSTFSSINSGTDLNESTDRDQNSRRGGINPENSHDSFGYTKPNQSINDFSGPVLETEPIEKSYKYDKYLFNEYAYPKNEFLHEEGRGLTNRKSNISHLRELNNQNSTSSTVGQKGNSSSNEAPTLGTRGSRGISLATKNIYNMFGSNDPFYVGWDQNLRKFVLTSRILSRSGTLNYNTNNPKPNIDQKRKPPIRTDFNNDNSIRDFGISNLANPIKNPPQGRNHNTTEKLESYPHAPIYSGSAFDSSSSEPMGAQSTKDKKRLQAKKPDFNQQSVHIYRPYTSWPFFKHQLKNLPNRPYFVLYENYLNILNKRIHLFRNININDIDTKSLTFLYSYSFNNNVKKYVSQLPINIYKQSMRPSSLENLFTPTSNARSSFLWPGSIMPAWEYYFW